jgi:hypothetical protein
MLFWKIVGLGKPDRCAAHVASGFTRLLRRGG